MANWGRTIRSVFGIPLSGLAVKLVAVADESIKYTLTEDVNNSGYYVANVPDGIYNVVINEDTMTLYSPVTLFNDEETGAAPPSGYGTGPYGDQNFGEGI